MTTLVLPVDQTTTYGTLLEFATTGSPLIGANAASVDDYPPSYAQFTSVEVDISIATELEGDYFWGLASEPTAVEPVDGTTSPGSSGTWTLGGGASQQWSTTDLYGWRVPDFGTYVANYVTHSTSAASSNTIYALYSAGFDTYPLDMRVRMRCADWDDADAAGNTILNAGIQDKFDLRRTTTGVECFYRQSASPYSEECAWGSLGFTDGEWEWLRFTMDETDGLRWWTGDGTSWSVAHTETKTAGTPDFAANWAPRIGNGQIAGSSGRGFDGDISDLTVYELGGALTFSLNRSAIDSGSDTSWSSLGSNDWNKGSLVVIDGALTGNITVRFEPEGSMSVGDVRLMFGTDVSGTVTIDQMTFELFTSDWFQHRILDDRRG